MAEGVGSDERQSAFDGDLREVLILGEKPIAWMDGIRSGDFSGSDD